MESRPSRETVIPITGRSGTDGNHEVLIGILQRRIKDERFLKLIRGMLTAGYVEDWKYHQTYSGTPQGGIVSPLLANIVLNELDVFVEDDLIPRYTKGINGKRKQNKIHNAARQRAFQAKKRGDMEACYRAKKIQRSTPANDPNDPDYKRLRYVRYADDGLLGLNGSKEDAKQIKKELCEYTRRLSLEMSEEKTVITHARYEKARFLNYYIYTAWDNNRLSRTAEKGHKVRSRNGQIILEVPGDVKKEWMAKIEKENVVRHRAELMNNSDYDIISSYESSVQGLINYY